jgi:nitroreductase
MRGNERGGGKRSRSGKPGFFSSLWRILRARPRIPDSLADNPLLQILLARRSVRRFTGKVIPEDVVAAILEAGRMAPSAVNLQTWTFLRFNPSQWRQVFGRPLPFGGRLALMILADTHRLDLLRDSLSFPEEPLALYTIAVLNVGLAAMNMTLAAEACGLSSVMLSETGQTGLLDAGRLQAVLELPRGVFPLTTLVIGYAQRRPRPAPPRLPMGMICGCGAYPAVDENALAVWLAEMRAGYRAMRPWSSLEAQIRVYAKKIRKAESALQEMVFGEFPGGGSKQSCSEPVTPAVDGRLRSDRGKRPPFRRYPP